MFFSLLHNIFSNWKQCCHTSLQHFRTLKDFVEDFWQPQLYFVSVSGGDVSEQVIGWGMKLDFLNLCYSGGEKEGQEVPHHTLQVLFISASQYLEYIFLSSLPVPFCHSLYLTKFLYEAGSMEAHLRGITKDQGSIETLFPSDQWQS